MVDFSKIEQFNRECGSITCIFGESGAGKSYLANKLRTDKTIMMDGDGVRYYINKDLGFSDEDRFTNNERIANIAYYLYLQGFDIIISTVRADIAYDLLKDKVKKIHKIQCYIS